MDLKVPATETNEEIQREVLKKISNKKKISNPTDKQYVNEISKKWDMNDKIVQLFERNIEKDQEIRYFYARILIAVLAIELIALIGIFIFVGLGKLKYSDTTFNIFINAGIAEVFVLVRVIVKYLFKDNLTEALNIILTNNNKLKNNYNKKNNKNSDKP